MQVSNDIARLRKEESNLQRAVMESDLRLGEVGWPRRAPSRL